MCKPPISQKKTQHETTKIGLLLNVIMVNVIKLSQIPELILNRCLFTNGGQTPFPRIRPSIE